jgi:predicted lipoprotein with Yx(FWY)xxD motif
MRPTRFWRLSLLSVLAAVIVGAAAGGSLAGLSKADQVARARVPAHARVTLRSSEYGKAIFDSSARVLYVFSADRASRSNCYGACASAWPPMLTKGAPTAGAGVHASLLGTTKRRDGTLQVTYNRHPLYYYTADKRGKIMCQHANMHGGFWYVVKANGTPNLAKSKTHM